MNKDFKSNIRIDLVRNFDDFEKFVTRHLFVLLVRVYHINQRTTLLEREYIFRVLFAKFFGSWEILNLKLNMRIIIDVGGFDLLGVDQEESFVRRHFLEDYSLNWCFAWFRQAHENDIHIILYNYRENVQIP